MRAKQSICYRQAATCGRLIFRLRPITIILIQSRNLFILAPPLTPSMASIWRIRAGSFLPSRNLSRTTKLIFYKAIILPVLLYSAESSTLLSTDAAALKVFDRKVLRKIFDPVRVGDDVRIRSNSELY